MSNKRLPFFFLGSLIVHLCLLLFLVLWTRGWFAKQPVGGGERGPLLVVNIGGGTVEGSGEEGRREGEKKKEEEKKIEKVLKPQKVQKTPPQKKEALYREKEKEPEKATSSIPSGVSGKEDSGKEGSQGSGPSVGSGEKGGGGSGGGGKGASTILAEIRRKIERAKHYPPLASLRHIEGVAVLSFRIEENGAVSGLHLVGSSGSALLDEEALATVRRAAPLPYYPKPIQIPLEFTLKED
jgi:protein TonB